MFRTVTHKAVCLVSKSGRVSMMLTRTTQLAAPTSLLVGASFTTLSHKHKAPGSDPLQVLQKECLARNLCDPDGGRLPGSHWVFCIAIAHTQAHQPPSLRTIGIERMSSSGIDFVMKKGHPTAETLMNGQPISFLHTQGRYLPGEKAEQWRGHGVCRSVPLATVLDLVPHFTITSMVGSRRVTHELAETPHDKDVSEGHLAIASKSHMTEVMQKTRVELENGDISMEELDASIQAFRLQPTRIECMIGGPDESVMWDRWEWMADTEDTNGPTTNVDDVLVWKDPTHLVPH